MNTLSSTSVRPLQEEADQLGGCRGVRGSNVAYLLVEAESHDAAIQMLSEHPQLALVRGISIEVIECPAIPG